MPESAVFTIAADITPQINQRELERQGQLIARQLNSMLAGKINKVDAAPVAGSFRPFEAELNKVQSTVSKFTGTLGRDMPKSIANVARAGKGAFLKFTDAVNITRRDMVGFGGSILDTLRNTDLFINAIEDIKTAGSGLSELPLGIEQMVAQARTGTTILDRAAFAGNQLAQFLQPLEANGSAANKELGELVTTLRVAAGAMLSASAAIGGTDENIALLDDDVQEIVKTVTGKVNPAMDKFGKIVDEKVNEALAKGGTRKDFIKSLNEVKNVARDGQASLQRFTGPLGFIYTLFNKDAKAARDFAQAQELGVNRAILKLGGGDTLSRFEKMALAFDTLKTRAKAAGEVIQTASRIFLKLTGLEEPVGRLVDSFDTMASGIVNSFRGADLTFNGIRNSVLGLSLAVTGNARLGFAKLKSTIEDFKKVDIGDFIGNSVNKFADAFNNLDAKVRKFSFGDAIGNTVNKISDKFNELVRNVRNNTKGILTESKAAKAAVDQMDPGRPEIRKAFLVKKPVETVTLKGAGKPADFNKDLEAAQKEALARAKLLLPKTVEPPVIKPVRVEPIKTPITELCVELQKCFESLNMKIDASIGKAGKVASEASKIIVPRWSAKAREPVGLPTPEERKLPALLTAPKLPAELKLPKLPDASILKAEAKKIGVNVDVGIAEGVTEGKVVFIKAAQDIKRSVITNINSALGIASGAKAMHPSGKHIVEGIAEGAQENAGILKSAIAAIGKAATTAINPFKVLGLVGKGLAAGFQALKPAIQGAGFALAGFVTTAAVTGIQFNTLKQVINATLPVVLGSASAARTLLDEVNELNDSSPFARQSFLELTKVLAGFGVEAEAITPLIDAIQQSVAATGGGEGDLLELGQAFARIQTQGRLTGETLQSFSVRGIDVISLLGKSMGKTTGEIKGMISDGMIPAKLALDTLTVALKDKFGGATDAVAKNFPGAMDRIKAKVRDFGGVLTAAFVDPEGGGALVELLNSLANALNHITKNILPAFRDSLEGIGENLAKIGKSVESFTKGISGDAVGQFVGQLGALVPLLGALVGLMPGLLSGLPVIGPLFAGMATGMTPVLLAFGGFLVFLPAVRSAIADLMRTIAPAVKESLPKFASLFNAINDAVGPLAGSLIKALGPILAQVFKTFGVLSEALKPIIASLGRFLGALTPIVTLIKTAVIAQIQVMQGQFKLLLAILDPIIKKIADLAQELKPFAEEVARFMQDLVDSGQIEAFFDAIIKQVELAVDAIQPFLDTVLTLKNALELIPGVDLSQGFKLPDINSARKELINQSTTIMPAVKDILRSEKFEGVFGHLENEAQLSAATALDFMRDLMGNAPEDILEVLADKDFKGAFGSLDQASKLGAAAMVDDIEFGADKILKILNEKDFRKTFKGLDAGAQLAQANLIQSGRDVQAVFDSATKSVETLTKSVGDANDQLKQAIDKASAIINGAINAAKAVESANAAIADAREKAAAAAADVNKIEQERVRALEDTLSPLNEIAVAERDLARTRKGLIDLGREELRIQQELAALKGEESQDKRAALDRAIERAKISLNKARRDEIDLLNETNKAQATGIDLSGLSVDEIKSRLALVRANIKADKKPKDTQEKVDDRTSARLDVADAEQSLKDATKARSEFELDNSTAIRDNEERLVELSQDKQDKLLEEADKLRDLTRLREGETSQQKIILEFDQKIKEAKNKAAEAAKGITTAIKGSQLAQAEFNKVAAEASGHADAILAANQALWILQGGDLFKTNSTLRDIMGQQLDNVQKSKDEAILLVQQLTAANRLLGVGTALQGLTSNVAKSESLDRTLEANGGTLSPGLSLQISQNEKQILESIRAALLAGAAELKATRQPWAPTNADVQDILNKIQAKLSAGSSLRDAIRDALLSRGLSMPGFAAAHGYAPGDLIHRGMNDGVGLMRMFEFGKEAVLPLTRKLDMARVVNNPSVLPKILEALPKISLPSDDEVAVPSFRQPESKGSRLSGVERRKEQRELATTISGAVKSAITEALSENGSLGSDIDINVHPPSGSNEALIAREVRRQLAKILG